MVEVPQLNTIEVGNTLEKAESNLINGLKLEAFDVDAKKENIDEMKEVLKSTTINIITSVAGVVPETKEALSLVDIATQFDKYVEKGEGWKLKAKEKDTDGNPLIIPEWITYIIENPKNNDLAYLVQKIAELVEYQTAKAYTESEVDAVKVGVDKAFGNQTRRALAGLKNRIESDISSTEKITFLSKSKINDIITANTKSGTIDKVALNKALAQYHLIFDDDKWVKIIDGYEFIDPNSNNYAVRAIDRNRKISPEEVIDTGEKDGYGNTIMNIVAISQLPINYTREEKKVYDITIDNITYRFYGNGRVAPGVGTNTSMRDSKEIVKKLNPDEGTKLNSPWTNDDITQQLQAYNLEANELSDITKIILQKKKDLDYGESGKIYFIIKEGKINIYAKVDYTKKIEEVKKQLRLNKIEEIKKTLPSEANLVKYPDGKFGLSLPALRGVVFDDKNQWTKFKSSISALLDKYAYNIENTKPETFIVSKKGNISFKPMSTETFIEDNYITELKQIEDYKGDSTDYRDEIVSIAAYLNSLACWQKDSDIA